MAEEIKAVCKDCEYFSSGLSENGYCKLYHHNLSMPERICSRYEPKKKTEKTSPVRNVTPELKIKSTYRQHLSYTIGVISSIVMILTLLLIDIVFAVELFLHPMSFPVKIGTLAVVFSGFLLVSWQTLVNLRKNRWLYIPYLIISIAVLIFMIFDFDNVWLRLNDVLNRIIEYVFYDIHNG